MLPVRCYTFTLNSRVVFPHKVPYIFACIWLCVCVCVSFSLLFGLSRQSESVKSSLASSEACVLSFVKRLWQHTGEMRKNKNSRKTTNPSSTSSPKRRSCLPGIVVHFFLNLGAHKVSYCFGKNDGQLPEASNKILNTFLLQGMCTCMDVCVFIPVCLFACIHAQ